MIRRTACLIARDSDPFRNQAIEKHLMDTLPEDTAILFLWQNKPAVMLGRAQNPWYECPVDDFLAKGGCIGRRLSGGGAMYQDRGSLNFSFILPKTRFDIPRQLSAIGMAVGAFGLQAQASGRNDLSIEGRKFCANAFFKSGSAAMHHGTILVSSQLGQMVNALTVEEGKLPVGMKKPFPQVVNLADVGRGVSMGAMQESLYWAFGRIFGVQPGMLDERMMDGGSIERMAAQFAAREWVYPATIPYTFTVTERFPWGGVTVQMRTEGGIVRDARVYTDAMEAALFSHIEQALVGSPCLISAITKRFQQRLSWITDLRLGQMTSDVCKLICGRLRDMARDGVQQ